MHNSQGHQYQSSNCKGQGRLTKVMSNDLQHVIKIINTIFDN